MRKFLFALAILAVTLLAVSSWAEVMVAPSQHVARRATEEWLSSKKGGGDVTLGEEWITYYSGSPAYDWWGRPERATWFDPTDFANAVYPFHIKKVKTIFDEHPDHLWNAETLFTFRIYEDDGANMLYESPVLAANRYPLSTEYDLGADSVEIQFGTFWLSVRPAVSDSLPSSLTDAVWQGKTWYGTGGSWQAFTWGEITHEAYVHWAELARDVLVMDILVPKFGAWVDSTYTPRARVKNDGSGAETFDVEFLILTPSDTEYIDTANVIDLGAGQVRDVNFDDWIPVLYDNAYTVKARTMLSADQNPNNDEFTKTTLTYEYGEIAYDDFEMDGWWVVQIPNGPQDAFAQKLIPYFSPPYVVTKFKIYVNRSTPFDNVRLCPDNLGVPNFSSPFQIITTPNSNNPPEWIITDFDTSLTKVNNSQPIWLCAQFVDGQDGPGVGGDNDPPLALKSYYTTDLGSTWNLVSENMMLRVVHLPSVGVAEEATIRAALRTRLYQNSPNPFRKATDIKFIVSVPVHASLKVYDISGSLVRTVESGAIEAGVHTVTWNGKDELGEDVGAGVYFYTLTAGEYNMTKKMVLLP